MSKSPKSPKRGMGVVNKMVFFAALGQLCFAWLKELMGKPEPMFWVSGAAFVVMGVAFWVSGRNKR